VTLSNSNASPSEDLFVKIFLMYCKVIPKKLNRSILTYFEIVLQRIFDLISNFTLQSYIISGKERHSGLDLTVFYCGDKQSFCYMSHRLFDGHYSIKKREKVTITKINKKLRSLPTYVDLVFIRTDRFFRKILKKQGLQIIPEWVNLVLDTSKSLEQLEKKFSSGARKDVKKIKKYGYTYKLTGKQRDLEFFYNRMFLPYILERHDEETTNCYLRYIKMILQRNTVKLLLVQDKDTYISGGLIDVKKDKEILPSMGILDANNEYLKKYASSALFYFHILSAKKRGINSINYGDTRTFLNDGNFQFKRKWGMGTILSRFRYEIIGLKILKNTAAVSTFLENNPFTFMENSKLKVSIYSNTKQPTTLKEIQHFCRSYYTPGITELLIMSPHGFTKKAEENELFEGTSKYDFRKNITHGNFLEQDVEVCSITKQEIND